MVVPGMLLLSVDYPKTNNATKVSLFCHKPWCFGYIDGREPIFFKIFQKTMVGDDDMAET